ncbi:MAG: di-heme oxidoredictase family protein [Myxococcota bacterium]
MRAPRGRPHRGAAVAALGLLACHPEPPPDPPGLGDHGPVAEGIYAPLGQPRPDATAEQLTTFARGQIVATHRFDRAEGLGPAFNVTFCAACHEKPTTGGAAGLYRNFLLGGRRTVDGAFFFGESAGNDSGVVRMYAYGGTWPNRPVVPADTTIVSQRNSIPFFGVGLLAELTADEILSRADEDDADHDGISGRPNWDRGFVGRFGMKSQTVSIEKFIRGPLFNHLGITTDPLSEAQRAALPVDSSSTEAGRADLPADLARLRQVLQAAAPDGPLVDDDDVADPEMSTDELFDLVSFAMLLAAPEPDPDAVHDPLSMPAAPTLSPGDFAAAASCVGCHPDHVAQWETSMHAYAMRDPLFRALTEQRQVDLDGREDQFCTQCHSAIGTRGGEIGRGFSFDDLSPLVQEGVTCAACHQAVDVVRDYNSGLVLDARAPIQGPFDDPVPTGSGGHASGGSALFADPLLCGGCHDVIETSGLDLERPYREWTQSPSAAAGQTCQDCHMPSRRAPAALGGPERTVHDHRWVGVDVPLTDGFLDPAADADLRGAVRDLLADAATLRLEAPGAVVRGGPFDVTVTVHNAIAGHALPTGSTFIRQLWLDVVATDATGAVVYATGQLDGNGDLMDAFSAEAPYGDPDLVSFASGFVDDHGEPTLFSWKAAEHTSAAIPPGYDRTVTLFVPSGHAVGPVTVTAALKFRAVPPYLLRRVGLDDAIARIETHTLAEDTVVVDLTE